MYQSFYSAVLVVPRQLRMFLPLSAPAARELLQFGVDMFLFMEVQRSRLLRFWVCWIVLPETHSLELQNVLFQVLLSVFLRSRWVMSHPNAIRALAGTVNILNILAHTILSLGREGAPGVMLNPSPACCCLSCSVSLGYFCS